jgi:hypothetical protein
VKNKFKAKFEEKILVWVAISPRGKSKALFFKSGLAINQSIYKEQCLDKGLLPFIDKYYPRGGYVFWPDLASSHYKKRLQSLEKQRYRICAENTQSGKCSKSTTNRGFLGDFEAKSLL